MAKTWKQNVYKSIFGFWGEGVWRETPRNNHVTVFIQKSILMKKPRTSS